MEPKIPLSCVKNLNYEDYLLIHQMKCLYCGGIFIDPVRTKDDNIILCKDCFYKKNNMDKYQEKDIAQLYDKFEISKMNILNKLKYYCPLCIKNNINNEKKMDYTYNSLKLHLITCQNQILVKKLHPNNILGEITTVYLKDVNNYENIDNILLANCALEKEIENEKLQLNYIDYTNYLNSKKEEEEGKRKNTTIKNDYINKKRKHENIDNNNSSNKNSNIKNKKSETKTNKKINYNKELIENLLNKSNEKTKNSDIVLVDICPHWKANYKTIFSCCNTGYGCVQCHYQNEKHHLVFSGESLCLFCNNKFKGDKCPICLVEKTQSRK